MWLANIMDGAEKHPMRNERTSSPVGTIPGACRAPSVTRTSGGPLLKEPFQRSTAPEPKRR